MRYRLRALLAIAALLVAACAAPGTSPATTASQGAESSTQPSQSGGATASDDFANMSWDEIVAAAKGQTVNWNHWGGDTKINDYVANYIGGRLKDEYGITLNPVLISDTVDAVNTVLGEKEAGRDTDGAVDLIWINGENFRTLKQANLLFGPYVDKLPNMKYVAADNPDVTYDAGVPIDGQESLWEGGQFTVEYDSAQVPDPPQTIPELVDWVCKNPGKFTYPAPPDFTGTLFLMHFFYAYAGGWEKWQGEFTDAQKAEYEKAVPAVWEALNKMKPCLWREGKTYPTDPEQMAQLMANGEIAFNFNYNPGHASARILDGTYPESIKTMVYKDGSVVPEAYVAIPYNSPNKAAAMVVANLILDPAAQLEKMDPKGMAGFPVLDMSLIPPDVKAQFDELSKNLGPSTLRPDQLEPDMPILRADMIPFLEDGWRTNVLQQ